MKNLLIFLIIRKENSTTKRTLIACSQFDFNLKRKKRTLLHLYNYDIIIY